MSVTLAEGTDLLYREASCLDLQQWDEWLDLYTEDCEYWVPAWKGEHRLTEDPRQEVSLIYYSNRAALLDRVLRVKEGRSVASAVLPRTQHAITNIVAEPASTGSASGSTSGPDTLVLGSLWTVHQFLIRESEVEVLFGRCRHTLVRRDGRLRIARKTTVLLNGCLPGRIDFYSL